MLMGNDAECPLGNKQPGKFGLYRAGVSALCPWRLGGDGSVLGLPPRLSPSSQHCVEPWGPLFPAHLVRVTASTCDPASSGTFMLSLSLLSGSPLFREFSSRGSHALGFGEESQCYFHDPCRVFPYLCPVSFSQAPGVHSEGTSPLQTRRRRLSDVKPGAGPDEAAVLLSVQPASSGRGGSTQFFSRHHMWGRGRFKELLAFVFPGDPFRIYTPGTHAFS